MKITSAESGKKAQRLAKMALILAVAGTVGCARPHVPGEMGVRTVIRSTAGATFKEPIESSRIGGVVMRDRMRTLVMGNAPLARRLKVGSGNLPPGAGGEAFETLLDDEKLPARTTGSLRFYVNGANFFPVYLQALKEAKRSIDAQTYIFDNDDFAVQVADVLRAKSNEVPVRVLFDGMGSAKEATVTAKTMPPNFKPPADIARYLKSGAPQIKVRRTGNAFFMADHSKLHIIDQKVAFVGGMNIGREYRHEWHDMMARVEGPIVTDLMALYETHWRSDAWWRKLQRRPENTAPVTGAVTGLQPLRMLVTDSRRGKQQILKATLLGIRCAKTRVWIETPYFSCDEITDELEDALKRGVDVRVVVPAAVDQKIMQSNNAEDLTELIEKGAKVYAYPGMTHLKATVCDDWGMFGSANYDTLSQRINVEMNLATSDLRTVGALVSRVFEPDFGRARRITAEMAKAEGGLFSEFVGDQL